VADQEQVRAQSINIIEASDRQIASGVMQCAGCQKLITDRYMYMVQERIWHEACVLCAECHTVLRERCYHRDGKFFCRKDFFR
jgi:hypothetical protein